MTDSHLPAIVDATPHALPAIVESRNKVCRFCGRVFTSAQQYYEDHIGTGE